jgi:hypothetical protein
VKHDSQALLAGAFCAAGWLSSFIYPLQLLGPYFHDCAGGNALPYVASMVLGPATLALSAMLLTAGAALGVRVHWPWPLHVGTLAVGIAILPGYLVDTTVGGGFICVGNQRGGPVDHPTALWQRAYAPLQNAAMVGFGAFLLWYRRGGRVPELPETPAQ